MRTSGAIHGRATYADMRNVLLFGRTRSIWIIYCHRCSYKHAQNINICDRVPEEIHYSMVLWTVLVKMYNVDFRYLMMKVETET